MIGEREARVDPAASRDVALLPRLLDESSAAGARLGALMDERATLLRDRRGLTASEEEA